MVEVPVANAEESSWTEYDCARSFGAEAAFGETDGHHFLLDVVALGLGQVAAGETIGHARQPHSPESGASFEATERCFSQAGSKSIALGSEFFCLGKLASIGRWMEAEGLVGVGAVSMFNYCESRRGAGGQANEVGAHVGGFAKIGSAVGLEVENHEIVEALRQFELPAGRVEETFPYLGLGLEAVGELNGAIVVAEHVGNAEVAEVGDVVDKAVACALMGLGLAWVAEFGALAELGHGFEEKAADDEPESRGHSATLSWSMGWVIGG
jgi:hypothetical protein